MNDRIILQSYGDRHDQYAGTMALTRPITERYAANCGADYWCYVGTVAGLHPSWNRIWMLHSAFGRGYKKAAWLDCDTLVVDLDQSIFAACDDVSPLQYVLIEHGDVLTVRNDGVIVANRTAGPVLEDLWAHRHDLPGPSEQVWIDRYAADHPEVVRPLDPRFNWFDWGGGFAACVDGFPKREDAVILAWHAYDKPKHEAIHDAFTERWGTA